MMLRISLASKKQLYSCTTKRGRPLSALRRFCTLMKQKYRGRITSVKKAKTTPATPAPVALPC